MLVYLADLFAWDVNKKIKKLLEKYNECWIAFFNAMHANILTDDRDILNCGRRKEVDSIGYWNGKTLLTARSAEIIEIPVFDGSINSSVMWFHSQILSIIRLRFLQLGLYSPHKYTCHIISLPVIIIKVKTKWVQ